MPIEGAGLPSAGGGSLLTIDVRGANRLLKTMGESGRRIRSEMRREMRQAANQIRERARGYAGGLGGDGTYASSLGVSVTDTGARIRARDEAAGVKEFAHPGAVTRGYPVRRVGVPHGSPPRALVRARDELEPQVVRDVGAAIDRALQSVRGE